MTDGNSRGSARKLSFVGPLAIAVIVVAIVAIAWLMQSKTSGVGEAPVHKSEPTPSASTTEAPPPLIPVAPPPIARQDLIARANSEAASLASGTPSDTSDPLLGRRFVLRLPFGCGGPLAFGGDGQASAQYDVEQRTIRLVARPSDFTQLQLVQSSPDAEGIELAEGFWILRPWKLTDGCPQRRDTPAPAAPTPPAAPTLGLTQLFEPGGSRLLRRGGRPYEFVRKAPEADPSLLTHSYRLVLEGRMADFGGGSTIRCWSESADHRPICLYAVRLERVAFEDGESGQLLAEWRE